MAWTRRKLLRVGLGATMGIASHQATQASTIKTSHGLSLIGNNLGVVIHSYPNRVAESRGSIQGESDRINDPIQFLSHAKGRGLGGVQVKIGLRDDEYIDRLRHQAESAGMYLEGIASLPSSDQDTERFESELKSSKRAGVSVVRCVMLDGRRYEVFDSIDAFRTHMDAALAKVKRAEPVARRVGIKLAIENHKDCRAPELAEIITKHGSEWVGVCLDTGNSIALLEDPIKVVETLAPYSFTVHFKDMGVQEYDDGFLLSEVPMGTGFLDLSRIVAILKKARPEIKFNIEMITRDPLKVPCFADKYWATFDDVRAKVLAEAVRRVRSNKSPTPLPLISHRPLPERLAIEEANVKACQAFAMESLGFGQNRG